MSTRVNPTFNLGGDLQINRMGYGAMQLTGPGVWGWPKDRENAKRVLQKAVQLGVNFIDTADAYGPHVNEELIAQALHPYTGIVIATKGANTRPGPGQWVPNGRPDYIRSTIEGSLKRLRLEQIDLWQLHRVDPQVPLEETLGVVAEARQQGLIRHVGLSEVSIDQIERAQKVVPIVSVQNLYNIAERRWEAELEYTAQKGLAFIPWFPLGSGPNRLGAKVEAVAKKLRATPAQVALAWLLRHSPNILLIPGTSSIQHLEENLAAAQLELSDHDLAELSP